MVLFSIFIKRLTLSDQGTVVPVGAQGGSMDPPKKTTFPPEFWNEIFTVNEWTIKNHNSKKNE